VSTDRKKNKKYKRKKRKEKSSTAAKWLTIELFILAGLLGGVNFGRLIHQLGIL
jgi:F0F1-type ATP synthase assembly protein I